MKTTPLTRDEKIRRLALLEEKRKRDVNKKPVYTPNAGQLPVHLSAAKERWVTSANGSGKTTALVNEIHWQATGHNPVTKQNTKCPCKIVVVLDSSDKIGEVFLPEYRKWFDLPEEWCHRKGKPYISEIIYPNGSIVSFYSAESDPMKFEGFMSDYVNIDEPLPRQLLIALRRSLRIKNSPARLLYFGTAVSQSYIRTEVYEPWVKGELPHVECFRVGIEVNRANLVDGYIEQFSRGLSEAEKETRLRGGWFDTDAQALTHLWDRSKHVLPALKYKHHPDQPCVIAIDPHAVKPHTAVMLTVDKQDRFIAIKEMSLRSNASGFARALMEWKDGYNVIDIVCDSLGSTEGSAFEGMASFIEVLQNCGIKVRSTQFKEKSAEDLVERLQNALQVPEHPDQFGQHVPRLRVLDTMRGLILDIESATWQKNRATGEIIPKIDTSIRDRLSCLGYALAANLFYDKVTRAGASYAKELPKAVVGGGAAREARRSMRIAMRHDRIVRRGMR